ncbi:MAG: phosphohydrolase [Candidatus Moraniibacteriota bacterium]|nr:MAG: phosphohydrolase [Candidatus Moranbacteria bacterium]
MTRQEAIQTLQVYVKTQNLIRHHYAVEAAMRAVCRAYNARTKSYANEETWALAALLHDADYELTRNKPLRHTLYLEEKLGKTIPPEVMYAIKAHNYKVTGATPKSALDWALIACDELTGFIVTCGLLQKDKKLNMVAIDMVISKMQEKSFAKEVDRTQIAACETKLGLTLREFIGIVLISMQSIAVHLGFEA